MKNITNKNRVLIGEDIMSQLDDFYDEMYAKRNKQKKDSYNKIIKSFETLSLEEKVNRLIEIYATEQVYN